MASSKETQQMLETFSLAFKSGDLAAAGVSMEEERCVETLQKLATAEFPSAILLKSQVGNRLSELKHNHPSQSIQKASAAVFDAMLLHVHRGPKKPAPAPKAESSSRRNKLLGTNVFELFQRAFKASSSSCEYERCVDGFNVLVKMELPQDLELLTYMGNRLNKLRETHPSSAVRKASAAAQNAVVGRLYHMNIPKLEVKRLQKTKIQRMAINRSTLIESY